MPTLAFCRILHQAAFLVVTLSAWTTCSAVAQNTGAVTGRAAIRGTGAPVAGAGVSVTGSSARTVTAPDGGYLLTGIASGARQVELVITDHGTISRRVTILPGDTVRLDFEVLPATVDPDLMIQSTAGGPLPRREVGYSIAVLTAKDLESSPGATLAEALQGRVPGLLVLGGSGMAGAGHQLQTRGPSSWLWTDRPAVFVDGVRVADLPYPALPGVSQAADPLDDFDLETIERVEVIRGPAAGVTAGQVTANGAIHVFTKRGTSSRPKWSFATDQGSQGLGHVGSDPSINPTGLGLNDCGTAPGCPESGSWLRAGRVERYRAAVRGGFPEFLGGYFLSAARAREEGVIAPQHSDGRSVRGSLEVRPLPSLHAQLTAADAKRTTRWIPDGFASSVFLGDRLVGPFGSDSLQLVTDLDQELTHVTAAASLTWTPWSNLRQALAIGWDRTGAEHGFSPLVRSIAPDSVYVDTTILTGGGSRIWTRTLEYAGTWELGLGSRVRSRLSWGAMLFDQTGDDSTYTVSGGGEARSRTHIELRSRRFFVRNRLGIGERWSLAGGVRWDNALVGDSIGPEAFPSAQLSYVLSSNGFWPTWWESLQLRLAIGRGGPPARANPSPDLFLMPQPWWIPPAPLRPERTREIEAGFQSSMFGGRLSLEYTYYDQRTADVLAVASGPFGSLARNVGTISNHGHELFANVTVVRRPGVAWEVGAQWSTNRSEVRDSIFGLMFAGVATPGVAQQWQDGEPLGSYRGLVVTNPDQVGAEPIGEPRTVGPAYPTFAYGLNTRLGLRGRLELSGLGEGQGGHFLASGTGQRTALFGTWPECLAIQQKIIAGDVADLTARQRAACDGRFMTGSEWTFPAGFFRLRTASLTYRLPERWLGGIGRAWIGLTARNLFVITEYRGLDPEAVSLGFDGGPADGSRVEMWQLPLPKSVALSLRIEM